VRALLTDTEELASRGPSSVRRDPNGVAVAEPAAPATPPLAPGTEFAGYLIWEIVGRGGMGVVYRAVDSNLERTVALKVIAPQLTADPAAAARFKREAKLAASIDHPNLVTIYAAGESDGVLFLAMQLVPGTDLRTVIASEGALDLVRLSQIVESVASALDAAHARGLVHRDVKPANILLTGVGEDEHVYLTDFGLTKRLGGTTAGVTHTGNWVGTPDYAAPEQIQGLEIDARTDVYSLGCVVHELLTGHRPYEKDSALATLWAHVADPPPSPCAYRSELLPVFDSVIACATAKVPEQRFPSAGALAQRLAEAVALQLGGETETARPPPPDTATVDPRTAAPGQPTGPVERAAPTQRSPEPEPTVARRVHPEVAPTLTSRAAPPAGGDAVPVTDSFRRRTRRLGLAAGLLVAAVVAAVLVLVLSGGTPRHPVSAGSTTSTTHPAATTVTPAVLSQEVRRLGSIVGLFVAGKRLSHVKHEYAAAAQNRRVVLQRLAAFQAPPQLRSAAETLRQMTADSLAFNVDMASGKTALAQAPDHAHNALRPRFLTEFNPYAQRYLGHTYTINDF
jgi:serine/threonine protein kinase